MASSLARRASVLSASRRGSFMRSPKLGSSSFRNSFSSFVHAPTTLARGLRLAVLILFALFCFSAYSLIQQPFSSLLDNSQNLALRSNVPNSLANSVRSQKLAHGANAEVVFSAGTHRGRPASSPPIALTREQELGAVMGFLSAQASNALPDTINPHEPIDPELILGFDLRSQHALHEIEDLLEDTWTRNPVVIFAKSHSAPTREMKAIIGGLNLHPPPTIFELDVRHDKNVLEPLILRLTSSESFPLILIGGQPIRSLHDLQDLQSSGDLSAMVTNAGAIIDGAARRKKGKGFRV